MRYVIEIGGMRGEVGKETHKKEMDNRRIFMTSHITLFSASTSLSNKIYIMRFLRQNYLQIKTRMTTFIKSSAQKNQRWTNDRADILWSLKI